MLSLLQSHLLTRSEVLCQSEASTGIAEVLDKETQEDMNRCRSGLYFVCTCTGKGYLISQLPRAKSRGLGLLTAAINNQGGIGALLLITVTSAILKTWAAARKTEVGTRLPDPPVCQQLGEISSHQGGQQSNAQWMGVSAGIWVVFTHKILRMAGIADDQGGQRPCWTPLTFVFSVP